MTVFKNSFWSFLILLFVILMPISCDANNKERNLSTPLSRLVGHWEAYQGSHLYFGPIDYTTNTGSLIIVYSEFSESMLKKFKKILREVNKKYENTKDWLNNDEIEKCISEYIENARKLSGLAIYCQYELINQIPNGEKIKIDILNAPSGILGKQTFIINKNGKYIEEYDYFLFVEKTDEWEKKKYKTRLEMMNVMRLVLRPYDLIDDFEREKEYKYKYIDSKTSPEDTK